MRGRAGARAPPNGRNGGPAVRTFESNMAFSSATSPSINFSAASLLPSVVWYSSTWVLPYS
jgi:hypothetical protein